MNTLKIIALLALSVLLTACGSNGLDELKRLCEKDAGLIIYKSVKADGYYNAYSNDGITNALIKGPYSYYEFCESSPSKSRYGLFPEPGCFRVKKVKREVGKCDKKIDKSLSRFIVAPYPEFLKDHCITVEKIEKPTARYSYHSGLKSWPAKNGVSEFIRSYALFKEAKSGNVLSEYISYSYNKSPGHTSPISCHSLDDKFSVSIKTDFIEKTIISSKEKRND